MRLNTTAEMMDGDHLERMKEDVTMIATEKATDRLAMTEAEVEAEAGPLVLEHLQTARSFWKDYH